MAGMFYSLQEAAERLNKTEGELKQIVKEGKLREFRDGSKLLFKVEEVEALMSDTGIMPSEQAPELEALEPEALESEALESEALSPEAPSPETPEFEALEPEALAEEPLAPLEQVAGTSEILLTPETGAPLAPSELTDADTALTGEGISVLGETDSDYQVTDDTMAETAVPAGTTPEMPLEEIEEDVNLDSFGSGSGLLDLSLQADDTSLGGILDEIYMAEGEGQEPAPAPAEVGSGSAAAVTAEAEEILAEEEPVALRPAPDVPALAQPYIELAPDVQSNTLGMLLFLPLVVILYTAVVAIAGLKGVTPSILAGIQGLIWYIMGGIAVLAVLVTGAAFMLGGGTAKAATKPKKPKLKKAPKAEKVKKPKEPKKSEKAEKDSS